MKNPKHILKFKKRNKMKTIKRVCDTPVCIPYNNAKYRKRHFAETPWLFALNPTNFAKTTMTIL